MIFPETVNLTETVMLPVIVIKPETVILIETAYKPLFK